MTSQLLNVRMEIREKGARWTGPVNLLVAVVGCGQFTYDVAYKLLDSVGGDFEELAKMSVEELSEFPGLGEAGAIRLQAAIELGRRSTLGTTRDKYQIGSAADAAVLMMSDLQCLDQEELWVILVDTKHQVIGREQVYKGSLNTAMVRIGEVLRPAIRSAAAGIVVVHNHPSGDPRPSAEDIRLTKGIKDAAQLLDIELLDHIVIGDGRYASIRDKGGHQIW